MYGVHVDERQLMLDDPSRQWVLLQVESALRCNVGGSAVMVEQIEQIAVVIDRLNVRLGIILWQAPRSTRCSATCDPMTRGLSTAATSSRCSTTPTADSWASVS